MSPARNARAVSVTTAITATFSQALRPLGSQQGPILQAFSSQASRAKSSITCTGNTLKYTPSSSFKPGETIFATITTAAQSSSGEHLAAPQVFQFTTATSPSTGTFGGGSDPVVGDNATSVTLGDLDGDGDLDMLTANYNTDGTVSVRLNDGRGNFTGKQEVKVGYGPYQVVLSDVDNDGDLDLLTANANTVVSTVSVRLNNGKGTFGGAQEVKTGENPHALALADVDGDGDLDLLVANYVDSSSNYTSSTVSVRLNNGTGEFASQGQEVMVGTRPMGVAAGDLDNDGDIDFVTVNSNITTASVRLNNGRGIFGGGQEVNVGVSPHAVKLGDIDGDGDLDLVTGDLNTNTVSIRFNNGSGSFSDGQTVTLSTGARSIALGDVDGDGDLDLLAATYTGNKVEVHMNNGTGAFTNKQEVSVGEGPYSLALGDVDGDGDLDFATVNNTSKTVSVRLNQNDNKRLAEEVSIYPNPAHLKAQMILPARLGNQALHMRIINVVGQTMIERDLTVEQLMMPSGLVLKSLANGVYYVCLDTSEGRVIKRVVVEK
ncbi:hypothetical protein BXP70_16645 [Hymenobacter crusticola]|uniref:SbsA Ig-like domain-containing protein n=1 Tax=Hymenobacter crusticola TaxID=1770526 RepID=A0A243WC15_9BACT|nr:hypothetical protein BXP70_16645 [Hymenobacter crusticola]